MDAQPMDAQPMDAQLMDADGLGGGEAGDAPVEVVDPRRDQATMITGSSTLGSNPGTSVWAISA